MPNALRNSFAVVSAVSLACTGVSVVIGCSPRRIPVPAPKTNIGNCSVTISKLKDGNVRFSIENVNGTSLLVQRHGDSFDALRFEIQDKSGNWYQLPLVNPRLDEDTPDPVDEDWVVLMAGDRISWYPSSNLTGRLTTGERVRIWWKTKGRIPAKLEKLGTIFPKSVVTIETNVVADGGLP